MGLGEFINHLHRPAEGRLLGGVCSAFARIMVADVTLIRLAFLVLSLASGLGLLLYLLFWLFIPAEGQARRQGERVVWSNMRGLRGEIFRAMERIREMWSENQRAPWPVPLNRRWFAVGLISLGVLVVLLSLGVFTWLGTARALGIAAIAVGASVLITLAPDLRR